MVTASGKVIETETELLQKKIEKKREEAGQTDSSMAVAQEIKEKEEAVKKKEYVFPPTSLPKKGLRMPVPFLGMSIRPRPLNCSRLSITSVLG